ncbi:hemolysin III [Komagataeibacter rhaeticus]|nr:hemolysin III [Komagataeibacter rhaeticus]
MPADMMIDTRFPVYSLLERAADLLVHILGLLALGCGVMWLVHTALLSHAAVETGVTLLYCGGILGTCLSSAAYNFCPSCRLKGAATGGPVGHLHRHCRNLYALHPAGGRGMASRWFCGLLWAMALAGVVLKMGFFTWSRRFHVMPYLCVAWVFFLCPDPPVWRLPGTTFPLLVLGLVFYCIGVVFYMRPRMPFSNVLWHVMVVLGAECAHGGGGRAASASRAHAAHELNRRASDRSGAAGGRIPDVPRSRPAARRASRAPEAG